MRAQGEAAGGGDVHRGAGELEAGAHALHQLLQPRVHLSLVRAGEGDGQGGGREAHHQVAGEFRQTLAGEGDQRLGVGVADGAAHLGEAVDGEDRGGHFPFRAGEEGAEAAFQGPAVAHAGLHVRVGQGGDVRLAVADSGGHAVEVGGEAGQLVLTCDGQIHVAALL